MNLRGLYRGATYEALPSRAKLSAKYHPSLSTMITELNGAPSGTTAIRMMFADEGYELAVGHDLSEHFAGRRVLFTMSKDNDLDWIAEWARWHARRHGTDAIVLFDNGSSRYDIAEVEDTIASSSGIRTRCVVDWSGRYGETDTAVSKDPYYVLFLQVSSMSVALRRFSAAAHGILNCDIDELVEAPRDVDIYTLANTARQGLVVMRGVFIEANIERGSPGGARTHRHYLMRRSNPSAAASRPKKWVLDPKRTWVENLDVHPYMHWIHGRPWFGKSSPEGVLYYHFRAINTNWKEDRSRPSEAGDLMRDEQLAAAFARLEEDQA